jgi:hypothetical protein
MENLIADRDLSESSDNLSDVYNQDQKRSEQTLTRILDEFIKKEELTRLDSQLL